MGEDVKRDESPDQGKVDKAKAWCNKARELIGYGLVGQSRAMYLSNEAIAKGLDDLRRIDKAAFDLHADEYKRLSKLARAAVQDQSDPQVRALIDELALVEAEIKARLPGSGKDQLAAQKDLYERRRGRATTALALIEPPRKDLAKRLQGIALEGEGTDAYEKANARLEPLLLEIERAKPGAVSSHQTFELEARKLRERLAAMQQQLGSVEHLALTGKLDAIVKSEAQQKHGPTIDALTASLTPLSEAIEQAIAAAGKRLERKRQQLADLVKLTDPPAATAGDRQALKNARDEIGKALAGVPTDEALDDAAKLIVNAQKLRQTCVETANARQAFIDRRKAVASALGAADRELDADSRALLLQRLSTIDQAAAKAGKKPEFDSQRSELDKLALSLTAAQAFNKARDDVLKAALVFIQLEGGGNEVALMAARDLALQAAAAEVKKGAWPAATGKLAGFKATLGGNQGKFDAIDAYARRLASFDATDLPRLREVRDEKAVPGWNQLDNEYAAARKKGTVSKNYAGAVVDLDTLAARLVEMQAYGVQRRAVQALTAIASIYQPPEKGAIDLALQEGDAEATNQQWSAAKTKLKTLLESKKALADSAVYGRALAALKKTYEALQAQHAGKPLALQLKASYDGAAADAALKKYNDAAKALDALRLALPDASGYLDAEREAAARLDSGYATMKNALLKPAGDRALVDKKLPEAVALLADLGRLLDALDAYGRRREEVTALRAAVPATDKARLDALDEVLKASATQAGVATDGTAGAAAARHEEARARLDELKLLPDFETLDAEVAGYRAELARVSKLHGQVHARLNPPPAASALADALAQARKPAETQRDYAGSLKLLASLEALVGDARGYIDARETALAMEKALAGIAASYSSAPQIYTPVAKVDLDRRLLAADNDAKAARFIDAGAKYQALLKDCRAMCAAAAKKVEAASYGRGHSMGRHGAPPDVDEPKLITRVTTGMAPDGHVSKTESATQFDDPASWLEAREKATERNKATSGGKFNPAAGTVAWADPLQFIQDIEHPKPIDTAVLGLKEKPAVDTAKGRIEGDGTYESHITVKGLTRTKTIFNFVLFNPKRLWEDNAKELDAEFKPDKWKTKYDGQTYNGKTVGAYVGEWILLTHYPITEGWDPETGRYTTPL